MSTPTGYFRQSASSPQAYERLQRLQREYGDMTADRSEIMQAIWDAYPLTDEERAQIERMKRGDYSGIRTRDEHGEWVRIP